MQSNFNKVIQSLWIGNKISDMEKLCINSFLQNGHTFHLYAYDDIDNLSDGVVVKDANSIIQKNKFFKDSNDLPVSFSDWFRYKLLFEKGGWWVDMDIVCLKPFDIIDEYCFATEFCSACEEYCITNCVMKSPAKAEFLKDILSYINNINDYRQIQWGEFGPILLKIILDQYDSKPFTRLPISFCPLIWSSSRELIVPNSSFVLSEESYSVHLWNTIWQIENYNKNGTFDKDSLYEKLKHKYLPLAPQL